MNKNYIKSGMLALGLALTLVSCDDFLDITPTGKVIATTAEEYRDLLTYEYKYFCKDRYMTDLRTDEIELTKSGTSSTDLDSYLDLWRWKDENPSLTTLYFSWRTYYHSIYIANYIIEHKGSITNGSADEISQLVGEAYMMRAYNHFLLVNLYAQPYTKCNPATTRGVPMMLVADVNAVPRCSSVEAIYKQVLADLDEAAKYMKVEKWDIGMNYRFNAVSVDALRARTYLYMGEWQNAYDAAKKVVDAWPDLEDLTKSSSKLPDNYQSVENFVALEAFSNNLSTVINNPSTDFVNTLYWTGDQRKLRYFRSSGSGYILRKYDSDNNRCSFRSAEAYLTAAEALVQLDNADDAIDMIKVLLAKRFSSSTRANAEQKFSDVKDDKEKLLQMIYDERARELAFEGQRWYDLRRTTQPQLTRIYEGEIFTLTSEKYTMMFPVDAVEANPEIELWEN